MPKNKTWFGGIILCAFPAMIFLFPHRPMPPWVSVLLWLFIIYGLLTILSSVFGLDAKGAFSWVIGALVLLGLGTVALLAAWDPGRFSGGIPLIPDAWNQAAARILFTLGGLFFLVITMAFLRKAVKVKRQGKGNDDLA